MSRQPAWLTDSADAARRALDDPRGWSLGAVLEQVPVRFDCERVRLLPA